MISDKHLTVVRTVAATFSVGLQIFIAVHILNLGGTNMGTILSAFGVLLLLLLPGGFIAALLVVGFHKLKNRHKKVEEEVKGLHEPRCLGCDGSCYKGE